MKIAICFPRHGDVKGEFALSLARMVAHTMAAGIPHPGGARRPEIEIFSAASSDLPHNRTELLKKAMGWQARYLLWIDTDHVFPPDSLLRLLAHELPVVGCNQARRTDPTGPVAVRLDASGDMEHVWTTAELARAGAVEEVHHVGLAFCLIDMLIFRQVQAHVEKGVGWANWNPFDRRLLPGTNARMGEDTSFFAELREAGIRVHVDHGLSWEVGHIGEKVYTLADAEAQKEAWLNRNS